MRRGTSVALATGLFALAMVVTPGDALAASAGCVGAAARDPLHRCTNPTISVTPAPDRAELEPDVPCRRPKPAPPAVCWFGAPPSKAKSRFAVVGDSHVYQWRATLEIVGKAKRWQGVAIATATCQFSDAVRYFDIAIRSYCTEWYRSVRKWFGDHPEIDTVFVAGRADTYVEPPPGRTQSQVKVAGYQRAWKTLPKTIKHIIVLRDSPKTRRETLDCVRNIMTAALARPGVACRVPRVLALRRDAAVVAANRMRSERFQNIDLTHYFCSATSCYPVIAGVLVNRDPWGHVTRTYSRTLAPYLLRKLRQLIHRW